MFVIADDVDDEGFVSDKQKYPSQHDPDTAEGVSHATLVV